MAIGCRCMQDRGLQVHNGSPEEQPGLVSYNLLRHPCARHTNRLLWITVALLLGQMWIVPSD